MRLLRLTEKPLSLSALLLKFPEDNILFIPFDPESPDLRKCRPQVKGSRNMFLFLGKVLD